MDELMLMKDMNESQPLLFKNEMDRNRKSKTTAVMLAPFLGGLGVHHFYLGRIGWGVVYLLFSLTGIPVLVALVELFFMGGRVDAFKERVAEQVAQRVRALA